MIQKLFYSWNFFFLRCIVFFFLIQNFGNFKKGYTGRNFEGKTLHFIFFFLHLVTYLCLHKNGKLFLEYLIHLRKIEKKIQISGNFFEKSLREKHKIYSHHSGKFPLTRNIRIDNSECHEFNETKKIIKSKIKVSQKI